MENGVLIFSVFILEFVLLYFFSQILQKKLSLFFFRGTKSKTLTITLLSFFFFPGVFVHEIAHYLAAMFLFVPAGHIEFTPQIRGDSVKLGSVSIAKTDPFRRMIIGVAPVLVGTAIIFSSLTFLVPYFQNNGLPTLGWILLLCYLFFALGNTMFSSSKDMEGTIELIATLAIVIGILYAFGFRVPLGWLLLLLNNNVAILKQADLFLLVPLGIDVVIFILGKIILRR